MRQAELIRQGRAGPAGPSAVVPKVEGRRGPHSRSPQRAPSAPLRPLSCPQKVTAPVAVLAAGANKNRCTPHRTAPHRPPPPSLGVAWPTGNGLGSGRAYGRAFRPVARSSHPSEVQPRGQAEGQAEGIKT